MPLSQIGFVRLSLVLALIILSAPATAADATGLAEAGCPATFRVVAISATTLTAAAGLSAKGQIVGTSGTGVAATWREKKGRTLLGTLGGTSSRALAINDRGTVVGDSSAAPESTDSLAFVWSGQRMGGLGTLGGTHSSARALNDRNRITGESETAAGVVHAFLWTRDGGMQDIDTFSSGGSSAAAINHGNAVAGTYVGETGNRAFVWTAKQGMRDLGTLGGATATASGISNRGRIVGASAGPETTHAFLWSEKDGMLDLGSLGGESAALAVNNHSQVVGRFATTDDGTHAFVWTSRCGMVDLNAQLGSASIATLAAATAINDRGRILASDSYGNTYLLIPQIAAAASDNGE